MLALRDWEAVIGRLVNMAAAYAAKWKDDPYVAIDEFQVTMGVPPSLTVNFRFKEPPGKPPP